MRDYALLAKSFRHCAEKRECASCPMYVKERKCPDFEVRKLAADAIEELLAENKDIKQSNKDAAMRNKLLCDEISRMKEKVPQWISVEESLPEKGKPVLVYGSRGGIYTALFEGGKYWWKLNSKSHYCKPTHWMPLPELPKEGTE